MAVPGGMRTGGIGCFGLLIMVGLAMLLGVDPMALLQDTAVTSSVPQSAPVQVPASPQEDQLAELIL